MDYTPFDDSVIFRSRTAAGERLSFNITITNDQAFEQNEDFQVNLVPEGNVIISDPSLTIYIHDDDC
jgi:hypothetical protein